MTEVVNLSNLITIVFEIWPERKPVRKKKKKLSGAKTQWGECDNLLLCEYLSYQT